MLVIKRVEGLAAPLPLDPYGVLETTAKTLLPLQLAER